MINAVKTAARAEALGGYLAPMPVRRSGLCCFFPTRHSVAGEEDEMAKDKVHTETIEVEGDHLLAKIKEIVHEGNVRRITITSEKGKRLMVIPSHLAWSGPCCSRSTRQ